MDRGATEADLDAEMRSRDEAVGGGNEVLAGKPDEGGTGQREEEEGEREEEVAWASWHRTRRIVS